MTGGTIAESVPRAFPRIRRPDPVPGDFRAIGGDAADFPNVSVRDRLLPGGPAMKPLVVAFCLLACGGVLLGDAPSSPMPPGKPTPLLEELVRMTRAGSSDVAVLAYARAHRTELPPEVSDDDLRWLRDSGVSARVVGYMTAIDVRASDGEAEALETDSSEGGSQPRAASPSAESREEDSGFSERYAAGYPDRSADSDAGNGYDDYPVDYDFDSPYGFGYSPYPLFFVENEGFVGRFHGRGHRFHPRRGFDAGRGFRGHRGNGADHGGFREAWRERGLIARRGSPAVIRPRGSARPVFASRGFVAGRPGTRSSGHRGFGATGSARVGSPHGFRAPGGFGRPPFSGGGRSGGGFRGGPGMTVGPSGGRARR